MSKNRGAPKKKDFEKKSQAINTRWTIDEWLAIDRHRERLGYKTMTGYVRDVILREMQIWGSK